MATRVYSPEEVKLVVGGKPVKGWTSITVDRAAENYGHSVASDGITCKTKNPDKSGTLEVVVKQQASEFYFMMAAVQQLIDQNPSAAITLPMSLQDPSGGTLVDLDGCWLNKMPTDAFSSEESDRTTMFIVDRISYPLTNQFFNKSQAIVKDAETLVDYVKQINNLL